MMIHYIKRCALRSRSLRNLQSIRSLQTFEQKSKDSNKSLLLHELRKNEPLRNEMAYSLSFASDEEAFTMYFTQEPNEMMREQLKISKTQLRSKQNMNPLPRTMIDAKHEKDNAIVVTESTPPFQIVYVNSAWEGLCGWTSEECRGKTMSILQGRETDLSAVTSLMNAMLQGKEGGTILTNYTKEGRRFRNHLRLGKMDEGFYVGVLKEINDGQ